MHKEATSDVASLAKLGVISGEPGATGWAVGLCHSYLCPSKPGDFHCPAGILNIISLNMVLWLISTLHAGGKGPPGPHKDDSLF